MKWFPGRGGEFSAIESALRAKRPRPSAELKREIADRVGASRARGAGRPVLALLMTTGSSTNGQAGAVFVHITGTGDFNIVQGDSTQTCLVPPPPK